MRLLCIITQLAKTLRPLGAGSVWLRPAISTMQLLVVLRTLDCTIISQLTGYTLSAFGSFTKKIDNRGKSWLKSLGGGHQ